MPIMVERDKWILYKHTSNYELIKAVALDVKNSCASDISDLERYRMQDRLRALDLYKTRNPKNRPLDSVNHRINTLEYYMFGYEDDNKRFIFSPLGNLFLNNIKDEEKLKKIFIAMLFAVQFQHPANGTPSTFQLYPFRLLLKLMSDSRLDYRLYSTEYAYLVAFVKDITPESYEELVNSIIEFRTLDDDAKVALLKEDEHTYVNCIYEWQYYTQTLLESVGILYVSEGEKLVKLFHPSKTNSRSAPTGRWVKNGFSTINPSEQAFVNRMLSYYSVFDKPLRLDDDGRMQLDIIKEIYSFYPQLLLEEIGEESDEFQTKLLELPKLIETYSQNPDNETAYMFENVLAEGFNMFFNVDARKIGGAGHTDIECLYLTKKKKFAVEAKSTANKLMGINAGRLREHRKEIGGEYTIVITPRYVPATKHDIYGNPIVIILASTFSEYLYNHIYHDVREIDYEDFDKIITNNLGKDVSKLISNMTMEKFATQK
ncbi:MAG: restriction endonuclease [Clostridia bacterium]|nr:restriction endonuclease [Clostridia bacterium]